MDKVFKAQEQVLDGDLMNEVRATARALRHPSEYDDVRLTDQGLTAVLCYAIERSAERAAGTSVNLAGIQRALRELRESVGRG